jgi:hypothetical protein
MLQVPTSLFKFLSVLEDSVWICILAAYLITSLIMWIFDRQTFSNYILCIHFPPLLPRQEEKSEPFSVKGIGTQYLSRLRVVLIDLV